MIARLAATVPPGDRALLERILSSDELAEAGRQAGWLDRIQRELLAFLEDLLSTGAAAGFATGVRWVFLAAVLGLAVWLARKVLRGRPAPGAPAKAAAERTAQRLDRPERHRALAAEARARGELRLAMRHRFLASLSGLEAERLVGWGRHKTNREYAGDLIRRDAPAGLRSAFGALVDAFDARWYGGKPVAAADLDAVDAACDRVDGEITARAAPGRAA